MDHNLSSESAAPGSANLRDGVRKEFKRPEIREQGTLAEITGYFGLFQVTPPGLPEDPER